jgi:hypothetical protein
MSTNSNASVSAVRWSVPTQPLGDSLIPRLCLGDHGFLKRYGSHLSLEEIRQRMSYASSLASLGLAAGDQRCLSAARSVLRAEASQPLLYHTDLPISLPSARIDFARCKATLYGALSKKTNSFIRDGDPLARYLTKFAAFSPYATGDVERLTITERAITREITKLRRFRPGVVTIGGDWLDFAFSVGRADLAVGLFSRLRQECVSLRVPVVLVTYTGALTMAKDSVVLSPHLYDALMLAVNAKGFGMFPNPITLSRWARDIGKPVIAMHALGVGRIPPLSSLRYVFEEARVLAAVVGASTYGHIDELISAGRLVLGPSY